MNTSDRQATMRDLWQIAAIVAAIGLVLLCGCELSEPSAGYFGDAELVPMCDTATASLESQFGCRLKNPVYVAWAGLSMYRHGNLSIREDLRGQPGAAVHVRHECGHALADGNPTSGGGHPDTINGVTAAGVLPAWSD